jgi:hypothetical protein
VVYRGRSPPIQRIPALFSCQDSFQPSPLHLPRTSISTIRSFRAPRLQILRNPSIYRRLNTATLLLATTQVRY